jgi:hypothetical protein
VVVVRCQVVVMNNNHDLQGPWRPLQGSSAFPGRAPFGQCPLTEAIGEIVNTYLGT